MKTTIKGFCSALMALLLCGGAVVISCDKVPDESLQGDVVENSGNESGIYLGVVGFNQQLYTHPVSELNDVSKNGFENFIDKLAMKNGTLLYYSVDEAIDIMQRARFSTDLSTVAIVTFTDGLDQGSMMMDVPYTSDSQYLEALNRRIMNERVSGQPITAYSIGIRGKDVSDVSTFRDNLDKLASSSENAQYAFEVSSMDEVNAKFKDIASHLSHSNVYQTITLTIPGLSDGAIVRFTLDSPSSAEDSDLYIEGTFNLADRSLTNVHYEGISSTSGTTVYGSVNGIFVNFVFNGVKSDDGFLVDNRNIDEWTYVHSSASWQINSEFDKNENTSIVTEHSYALIMLVLDCSSSLSSDFVKAQKSAKDFVKTLSGLVEGGNTSSGGGNTPTTFPYSASDLSSSETSNCYIVSKGGTYKFKTFKGNSNSLLNGVSKAEVLWESFGTAVTPSVGDLLKYAVYKDGYIAFQTADTFKEGNAVIAAKDAAGNILWSWHIWLTDQPQEQVYFNNAGTMMDRNLGATSATPGDVGALGLLYQWGRKDPFLGASSISSITTAKSTISWPSPVSTNSSCGTVSYVISNPTTFVTASSSPYDWHYSSRDNTLWTTSDQTKSIYDPCPAGWRVPDGGSSGVWSKALGSSSYFNYTYNSINEGMNFSGKFGSASTIWYPASGYRYSLGGGLDFVGYSGFYWSASPYSYGACGLGFSNDGYVDPSNCSYRAYGYSVRCLQESK